MDPEKNAPKEQQTRVSRKNHRNTLLVICLIALLIAGVSWYLFGDKVESPNKTDEQLTIAQTSIPSISLNSTTKNLNKDEEAIIEIWSDSKDANVNAIQVVMTYEPELLEVTDIDYDGSAYEIEAVSSIKDGTVRMERAKAGGVSGKNLVAKLQVKAKQANGTASIEITDSSLMLRSSDSTNILQTRENILFTLGN